MSMLESGLQIGVDHGYSSPRADEILTDQYRKVDLLMERFLQIHCLIAFGLAFVYSTWAITIPVSLCAFSMFAICRRVMPNELITRCVAGVSLQIFVALHIYQMHGLPEMHFFFFTAQTMMILYYDARAFWLGTALIIVQHIVFSALTNAGYQMNFFPDSYVSASKQFFHYSIAVGQVAVCAYWAQYLRHSFIRDTEQRNDMLQINADLVEAREAADRATMIKGQFLANMSHELRTPLNGVIGMSALLQETETSEANRDYVDCIRSSGETLLTLINDILDFSKIEAGKVALQDRDFGIETTIDEVLATMQSKAMEKGLELLAIVDETVPRTLKGDCDRLKQIWINLIGNALKFTNVGSVIVYIRWEQLASDHGSLETSVCDTGIGIPEEMQESIFESFSQVGGKANRENGGTGLGLAISRQLAIAMGGGLTVKSELGHGSTFSFDVPLSATPRLRLVQKSKMCLIIGETENAAHSLATILTDCGLSYSISSGANVPMGDWYIVFAGEHWYEDKGPEAMNFLSHKHLVVTTSEPMDKLDGLTYLRKPFRYSQVRMLLLGADRKRPTALQSTDSLSGRRFLVVEDNPVNQRILSEMLRRQGAHVDLANNGELGLVAMKEGSYDIVFMDCQMPVMDGFEATRVIRESEKETGVHRQIVATTANAMSGDREACIECGMDDYVTKPITRAGLFGVVDKILIGQTTQQGVA